MPGTVATATAVPPSSVVTAEPSVPEDAPLADAPRGRHSRVQDEPPEPPAPRPSGSGRHARGRGSATRPRTRTPLPALPLEPLDLDLEGRTLAPEEVDEIADQMLTRLAVSEERPRFFDPDDLPGGKVVFMAGCGFAVLVVLFLLYTLLGLFLG